MTYQGKRTGTGCIVEKDGEVLDWRLDLFNHSPSGLEWGYNGSGSAQLALAILADYLDDDDEAVQLHQDFARLCIAGLEHDEWEMTENQVRRTVLVLRAGQEKIRRQDGV